MWRIQWNFALYGHKEAYISYSIYYNFILNLDRIFPKHLLSSLAEFGLVVILTQNVLMHNFNFLI